jgi:acyl-[acyl carrier protein]--UDP-N-acetylglucosamine O-acyltransferase
VSSLLHLPNCPVYVGERCECPSVIHPTAIVGGWPEARNHHVDLPVFAPVIGYGCRLNPYVTVDSGTERHTTLGNNVFCLTKSHIGHDCLIGDGCEITAGATLAGWVELGRDVRVGINAALRPRVKVGDGARIGAGAVVTKDVPAGETWAGCPARPIENLRLDPLWAEKYAPAS